MATRKRVQSDPNLPLVPLRPSIQAQGGTFPTVGIDVPKSNSAQRIATALNRLPGLTGQLSNINQQRGVEAAEQLSAEELNSVLEGKITPPDGGITGGLGFRKGFAITHAKRWWETVGMKEAAELENELDEVVDNLVKDGQDIGVARGILQERINEKKAEITEYFDKNPFSKGINNLILPQVFDKLEVGLLKGYQKKIEDYNVDYQLEKINEDLGKFSSGLAGISFKDQMKNVSDRVNKLPISNTKKKEFLRNGVKMLAQVELNNRNFGKAKEIISEGSAMNMFGDLESSLLFSDLSKAVRIGEEQRASVSIPALSRKYLGANKMLSTEIRKILNDPTPYTKEEVEKELENPIKNLINALYDELGDDTRAKGKEEFLLSTFIRDLVANKDPKSLSRLQEIITDRVLSGDPDSVANQILNASAIQMAQFNAEQMRMTPSERAGYITPNAKKELLGDIIETPDGAYSFNARQFFKAFPTLSTGSYMAENKLSGFEAPEEVRRAFLIEKKIRDLKGSIPYKALKTSLGAVLKALPDTIEDYEDDIVEVRKTPGGFPSVEEFNQEALIDIQFDLEKLFDAGDEKVEDEEKLKKTIEEAIKQKAENYRNNYEARKTYSDAITRIGMLKQEGRRGRARYAAEYAADKSKYSNLLLEDWGWLWNETKEEWVGIKALQEQNLDVAIGYTKDREDFDLTASVLLQNINDTRENDIIARDQENEIDVSAFKSLLLTYGYPTWQRDNVVQDLERIGSDWTEVKLFRDKTQLKQVAGEMAKLLNRFGINPDINQFTKDEQNLLKAATGLGLYPDEDEFEVESITRTFIEVQENLIQNQNIFKE